MGGWASNSKYPFLGAIRSAAQMVSYEVSIGIIIINVLLCVGSLNLTKIVMAQENVWFIFPLFPMFIVFFISALAETNRPPFDLPEAESELVAGWMTEYSGFRWAVFFLSEYANMFVISGLAVAGFLGGWQSPIPGMFDSAGWGLFWFMGKVIFLIFLMMWFRWTFPRLRVDQLMHVCWKVFIPIAMFNIFGVGIWKLIIG